ncbi:translation initiation factor IF-2-like [Marmota marmota marmota]|uniref:translation initiation factor IF-2-like n=1 Tax=Marmota marmota marmota TaxID=9994 RepID=UPI00209347B1|nr:translation initiation factor IF-2-like [Marmota marmota marmota]
MEQAPTRDAAWYLACQACPASSCPGCSCSAQLPLVRAPPQVFATSRRAPLPPGSAPLPLQPQDPLKPQPQGCPWRRGAPQRPLAGPEGRGQRGPGQGWRSRSRESPGTRDRHAPIRVPEAQPSDSGTPRPLDSRTGAQENSRTRVRSSRPGSRFKNSGCRRSGPAPQQVEGGASPRATQHGRRKHPLVSPEEGPWPVPSRALETVCLRQCRPARLQPAPDGVVTRLQRHVVQQQCPGALLPPHKHHARGAAPGGLSLVRGLLLRRGPGLQPAGAERAGRRAAGQLLPAGDWGSAHCRVPELGSGAGGVPVLVWILETGLVVAVGWVLELSPVSELDLDSGRGQVVGSKWVLE